MERIPRVALRAAVATATIATFAHTSFAPTPSAVAGAAPHAGSLTASTSPTATGAEALRVALPRRTARRARQPLRILSAPRAGVRQVQLTLDGRQVARLEPRGGRFRGARGWIDTSGLVPGRHVIRVALVGADGRTARARSFLVLSSASVNGRRVKDDTTGPTLTVRSPAPDAVVAGVATFRADASDPSGIRRVDFRIDGALVQSDVSAPYGDVAVWDSRSVADGHHELRVVAVDGRGNITAAAHAITVRNESSAPPPPPASSPGSVLWGAWVDGRQYGFANPPWDMRGVDRFEANAGRRMSILHFGLPWYDRGAGQPFNTAIFEATRQRGAIPLVDWNSWDLANGGVAEQPAFQLQDILAGRYDTYIRSWATGAKAWGKPLYLRFNHEMNGTWYPWSEARNGNRTGEYAAAWRHVRGIFDSVGARNVAWVWSPNAVYPGSLPLAGLYPGDAQVDWVAIDGYNWGTNPLKPNVWASFSQVFGATYTSLGSIAPGKPIMIAETASTESGGSKAAWITDAVGTQVPQGFPRIKALVWFNWNASGLDWVIETSAASQAAFATAISSGAYAANDFGAITAPPVPTP